MWRPTSADTSSWLDVRSQPPTGARRTLTFASVCLLIYIYRDLNRPGHPFAAFAFAVMVAVITTAAIHGASRLSKASVEIRNSFQGPSFAVGALFAYSFASGIFHANSMIGFATLGGAVIGLLVVWFIRPRRLWVFLPNSLCSSLCATSGSLAGMAVAVSLGPSPGTVRSVILALSMSVMLLWVVTLLGFAFLGDGPVPGVRTVRASPVF